jgi:hypothetical protein
MNIRPARFSNRIRRPAATAIQATSIASHIVHATATRARSSGAIDRMNPPATDAIMATGTVTNSIVRTPKLTSVERRPVSAAEKESDIVCDSVLISVIRQCEPL